MHARFVPLVDPPDRKYFVYYGAPLNMLFVEPRPTCSRSTRNYPQRSVMHSFTLAGLGFLGLRLNGVSAFHVPVPIQSSNMRTSSALRATESTSEDRASLLL